MATVVARPAQIQPSPSAPLTPHLSLNTSNSHPVPVPNKHLPTCSPGPIPVQAPVTPPASPPNKQISLQTPSLLYPPDQYELVCENPPVRSIDAAGLALALEHISSQPLPDPTQVFPWLHGLHPENHIQLTFFVARRKSLRRTPKCLRSITLVKVGGDLASSKLKGAVAPDEILPTNFDVSEGQFLEPDPRDGFSVRNFQIQVGKMATVSDVVVYGDESQSHDEVVALAKRISEAQMQWYSKHHSTERSTPLYNTFVVTCK
jgi:dual specificity MAP kinase phosphatase